MLSFHRYLTEQEEGESQQVKHLTHVEDYALQKGSKGTQKALSALSAAAEHIRSGKNTSELTTKYDGSPALVYGRHPENGKFFVASKSAFNKTPKINYTVSDIEKNHGHAPGLAQKLKDALKHLPKIAPEKGVYQGDMMFSKDDKVHHGASSASFQPNPSGLTYTAHGHLGKKARKAHIGVVTHLTYQGKDAGSLNASHEVDHENFKEHPDVFTVDPRFNSSRVHFDRTSQTAFRKHLNAAQKIHDQHGDEMYGSTERHQGVAGHLESFINHTVRTGEDSNHENFKKFIETKHNTQIEKLKTDKSKEQKKLELVSHLHHIDRNQKHYNNLLKMHRHIQDAKDVLINTMNQHQDFQHSHAGEESGPEGYVFHHNNSIFKFVNRREFSRRNFLNRPR